MKTRIGPVIFMVFMCVLALVFGLAVPALPLKLSLLATGMILSIIGLIVVLLLPDNPNSRHRLVLTVMFIAFAMKFLWPNFSYIPINALPSKNPQRLVWAVAIAFWLYSLATSLDLRQRLMLRLRHSGVVWMVFALFIWRAASIGFSRIPELSTYTVLIEFFDYLPALLFALTWIRGEGDIKLFGRAIVITTLVISAITAAEVLLKQNLFQKFTPTDLSNEEFLVMAVEEKLRGGVYRAQASFNHPLLLAQYMVTVLPILLLTLKVERGGMRALTAIAIASVPVALWASRTRTAIVVAGFVLAAGFLIAAVNRTRERGPDYGRQIRGGLSILGAMAAAGVLAALIYVLTVGRTSEETVSSNARVEMVERAVENSIKSPMFGFGPGMGAPKAAVYSSRGTGSLDSYWLILLLDSGIPAMVLFVGLLWAGVANMFKLLASGHQSSSAIFSGMWGTAVVAFGLTTTILGTPHNLPLLYFLLGSLIALKYQTPISARMPTDLKDLGHPTAYAHGG